MKEGKVNGHESLSPISTVPVHDLQAAPGFCCPKPGSLHSCSLHSTDDNTSALELYRPDLHFYFLLPVNISCQSRACKPNYTPLLDCLILKICHEVIYDTNYWEGGWMSACGKEINLYKI